VVAFWIAVLGVVAIDIAVVVVIAALFAVTIGVAFYVAGVDECCVAFASLVANDRDGVQVRRDVTETSASRFDPAVVFDLDVAVVAVS
jgi:hypothetical protein